MTYAEGSYYFNCTGEMVLAGQTFKIADANWTEINYGVEEGAIVVIQDDAAIWEPATAKTQNSRQTGTVA